MASYTPLPSVGRPRQRNLRLADLYLRQGEQQAEAELRSGAIKAQLFGDIGRTVGQTAASIIQAPQMAREQAAAEAERAQRTKMGALQLGEAERQVNDRENYDLAMTAGSRQKTLAALKDRPELYEKAQGHFTRIDTSMKQLMGDTAAGIADFGYTPDAAIAAMDDLIEQGFDERKIEPFRAAIMKDPSAVKQIVDSLLSQSPDPRHQAMARPKPLVPVSENERLYDPNTNTTVVDSVPKPPPAKPNPTEASLAAAAAAGDQSAQRALELLRKNRASANPPQDNVLVPIVGEDGKTRYGTRSEARGQIVPSGQNKPASGLEKRALNFFNRARQADVDVEGMESEIQKLDLGGQTWLKYAPNFAQTTLGQQYTQAQRAFTEARLRKDSGAAIPPHEYAADRETYFAEPGDDPETLEQKRRGRAAVLASLGYESGQALGEFVGDADEAAAIVQNFRQRSQKKDLNAPLKDGQTVKVGGFTVKVKPQ